MKDIPLRRVDEGTLLLEYGPITMLLESWREGRPDAEPARGAADALIGHFEDLTRFLDRARRSVACLNRDEEGTYPLPLRRMAEAVRRLGEDDFTPMAAVAGTFADLAVEAMVRFGADYALANNGGDVAFRLSPRRERLAVGIVSDLARGRVSHRLILDGRSGIRGLATSGFGGRSLTRGVASAVTVLAEESRLADAAATSIANACDCDDPAVERCLAEEIDYDTDIPGLTVTRSVPRLSASSIKTALQRGSERAEELCAGAMIRGAVLFVAGSVALRWQGEERPFILEAFESAGTGGSDDDRL